MSEPRLSQVSIVYRLRVTAVDERYCVLALGRADSPATCWNLSGCLHERRREWNYNRNAPVPLPGLAVRGVLPDQYIVICGVYASPSVEVPSYDNTDTFECGGQSAVDGAASKVPVYHSRSRPPLHSGLTVD